uniref:Candidate secreted effector n=1 Tax=Meloidogyne incognita TaxID=6306 RepID=A0A914KW61_MELIC
MLLLIIIIQVLIHMVVFTVCFCFTILTFPIEGFWLSGSLLVFPLVGCGFEHSGSKARIAKFV